MNYFLFKTEPDVYSFDDFLRDKETLIVQIEPDIPRELSDLGVSGADSTENYGSSEALGEPVPQSLLFPK